MERWKDIDGFPGYQVSDKGNVRTFWQKRHYPTGYGTYRYLSDTPSLMSQSDDGNGYMKVMLYSKDDGKRYCKKVHRLVAEAFEQLYFSSIKEASFELGIDRASISHILCGDYEKTSHYTFEYASWEDRLLYGFDDC